MMRSLISPSDMLEMQLFEHGHTFPSIKKIMADIEPDAVKTLYAIYPRHFVPQVAVMIHCEFEELRQKGML